jgi:hypothetical protein
MTKKVDACSAEQGKALLAATDNPVGVLFDPEVLVARWGGEEAEEALLAQPPGEEAEEALLAQPPGEPSPIPATHGMG